MSKRGFFGVAVLNPRHQNNVGGLWRAAHNFHADWLATVGARYRKREAADTTHAALSIPLWEFESLDELADKAPLGCKLIGVEQGGGPTLDVFVHPDRALYIFGNEANGLPSKVQTQWCHDVVTVGTASEFPLNVATCGGIVMHHRHTTERLARAFAPA